MDAALAKIMEENTPSLNRDIADGLATKHMQHVESRIDSQIRSVARYFPEDLVYVGFRRCTPNEEYRELTRRRTVNNRSKCSFNLARTDTYMVAYHFQFKGEDIIRYMRLPFINNEGTMYIAGVRFTVSPVMCDKIISIGVKDVFVKLNLAKVTFQCEPQYYIADNNREMVQLIYSEIYNRTKKNKELPKNVLAKTTITHYLLCRYGFTELFKTFGDCNPILGYEEINTENYPESDWVICESVGLRPKSLKLSRGGFYQRTNIRMAVRRDEYTAKAKNHIVTFFYLLDHWPERIRVQDVNEVRLWKQLLGELIWGSNTPLGRLEADTENHLEFLDNYIDEFMKFKFEQAGMPIENLYQLFGIIMANFNEWLLSGSQSISSTYNKELDVLYYVLTNISEGINNFYFGLKKLYKKKDGNVVIKEVINLFNRNFLVNAISKLSNTGKHIEVSTIDSSCDNKAFKTTALVVPQESTSSNRDNKTSDNPSQHLHVSIAEVNAYSAINKKDPSGHNRINPMVQIDANGNIVRNEKFRVLLDDVQQYLNR